MAEQESERQGQKLAKFFLLSFEHSQGSDELQRNIFRFAKLSGYFTTIPKIDDLFAEKINVPFGHKTIKYKRDIAIQATQMWDDLELVFKTPTDMLPNIETTIAFITKQMLDREINYQINGRFREKKYKSYLYDHAIKGVSTGDPIFDTLFSAVSKELEKDVYNEKFEIFNNLLTTNLTK